MACGLPTLASAVPPYVALVQKTRGGKICESLSDWASVLDEIDEAPEILWEWSQAAHVGVKAYSTEKISKTYVKLVHELLS